MAPNPRVAKAFRAMKGLGIPEAKVKPVLKNLLKLYEKNWELIEEENYRALADAIFDNDEAKAAEEKKVENAPPVEEVHQEAAASEAEADEEPERPLKRLRLRHQDGQASPSVNNSKSNLAGTSLVKPKEEPNELIDSAHRIRKETQGATEMPQSKAANSMVEPQSVSCQPLGRNKGKEPVSPKSLTFQERSNLSQSGSADGSQHTPPRRNNANSVSHAMRLRDRGKQPLSPPNVSGQKRLDPHRSSQAVQQPKETTTERGNSVSAKQKMPCSQALIKPKEEPFTGDLPQLDVLPIAVIHPESSNGELLNGNGSAREQDDPEPSAPQAITGNGTYDGVPASSSETRANGEVVKDAGERLEVAATPCGKVKIALTYDLACERPDVHIPSLDTVLEMVKDKCRGTYKILDPNFSVTKVMNDMCNCFLELGTGCTNSLNGSPTTGCDAEAALAVILPLPPPCNSSENFGLPAEGVSGDNREIDEETEQENVEQTDSQGLVENQCQPSPERISSLSDVIDIAKGQEGVVISLVNEVNNDCPPSFHYIPQNAVFQNAYVSYSLARIGDNNCCSTCSGDCLSLSTPCACAHEMGGDFAYTTEGLVKEDFLKECISMNRDPEKHCQFFCKICPLERSKNEDTVEPCKGHLVRKFIKECWWKCGCNKQCGNRVVQRGISRKLQVFMTPGGKGWGLRTLEDLPKGAFVCEYVGEVLTNAELFDRVSRSQRGEEHSYPVLLDADWGSEGVLKDEEALCLDATYYGNVARFINHRCFDSTLVEIPVEVETPDHHYYHLAFFTTRKVKAMEELTWDYGIDFDDIDHPVKAFRCQCGSKYCRNIKRTSRSRCGSRR